jgi:AcrR family transcriptional regulator
MAKTASKARVHHRRDRETTRRRILTAVGAVLASDGFRGLGINAVARRAEIDKVLIYRYFGSMPDLLAAYAEEGDFWWTVDELIGPDLPLPARDTLVDWMMLAMRRHIAGLRARPITLEIMAWETIAPNELTAALSEVRERRSLAVMERLAARFVPRPDVDIGAVTALFGAAANYLLIRARGIRHFQGLDLADDGGWERLLGTMQLLATGVLPR